MGVSYTSANGFNGIANEDFTYNCLRTSSFFVFFL